MAAGLVPSSQVMPEGIDVALIGLALGVTASMTFLRSLTLALGRVGTRHPAGAAWRVSRGRSPPHAPGWASPPPLGWASSPGFGSSSRHN